MPTRESHQRSFRVPAEVIGGDEHRAPLAVVAVLTDGRAVLSWEHNGREIAVTDKDWQSVDAFEVSFNVKLAEKAICGEAPILVFDPPSAARFAHC